MNDNITLLFDFPRVMGNPVQNFVALNTVDFESYLRTYIQYNDIYITVYTFKNILVKETAKIDKVFFDFDGHDKYNLVDALNDVIKLHEKLLSDNILHTINFSGGGFHLFIFCNVIPLLNPSNTIYNVFEYYKNSLNLKTLDIKIRGDLRRIFRVPNTYNFGRKKLCVNINDDIILYNGIESIYKYAEKPKPIRYFGEKLLNIKTWDKERDYNNEFITYNIDYSYSNNYDNYSDILKEILESSPECFKYLVNKKHLNYNERYFVMLYLKETYINNKRLSYLDIVYLMKEILDEDRFLHFSQTTYNGKNGEGLRPLNMIMNKDYYIPDCKKIKFELKACNVEYNCGRIHPKYKKLKGE